MPVRRREIPVARTEHQKAALERTGNGKAGRKVIVKTARKERTELKDTGKVKTVWKEMR